MNVASTDINSEHDPELGWTGKVGGLAPNRVQLRCPGETPQDKGIFDPLPHGKTPASQYGSSDCTCCLEPRKPRDPLPGPANPLTHPPPPSLFPEPPLHRVQPRVQPVRGRLSISLRALAPTWGCCLVPPHRCYLEGRIEPSVLLLLQRNRAVHF